MVSDAGVAGFDWDRAPAAVGVGMDDRGKGRREEGFGILLAARATWVALLTRRFSSILMNCTTAWIRGWNFRYRQRG